MSVFEPPTDPEPDDASQLPALDVPLRGRKGQQVTAYIEEVATRLDQQRARAERAERAAAQLRLELDALRNQPPPSFQHLGAEAAKILDDAGRSAKVLVEEATDRGKEIVEKADEDADQVRAGADRDAQTRLDAARQAAEQMLAKANGQRAVMEAEIKRLREYHDGLLNHLGRVQADLGGFLAEVGGSPPSPPAKSGPSGASAAAPTSEPSQPRTAVAAPTPDPEPARDVAGTQAEPDSAPAAAPKPSAASAIAATRAPK